MSGAVARGRPVRRLNRMPIIFVFGILGIVFLVIAYVFYNKMEGLQQHAAIQDASGQVHGSGGDVNSLFPTPGVPPQQQKQEGPAGQPTPPPQGQAQPTQTRVVNVEEEARRKAWEQYYEDKRQFLRDKEKAEVMAYAADSSVGTSASSSSSGATHGSVVTGTMGGAGVGEAGNNPGFAAGTDAVSQAEKRSFMGSGGDVLGMDEDLDGSVHGPKPDTIMAGTPLSGVILTGTTSDMPGMVTGQIDTNVYDTSTGTHLLIPQGTKVNGFYDNSVSNGQTRIGVNWTRLIFPDGSSRQLGSMEGADQAGYAGMKDKVDKHFWEKFGTAIMISIAGAGAQLSQPQAPVRGYYSPTQIGTAQMAQGMNQFAQMYAQSGLQIPNTLEIRPGYRFTIMVNKDLALPPYADHRVNDQLSQTPIFQ